LALGYLTGHSAKWKPFDNGLAGNNGALYLTWDIGHFRSNNQKPSGPQGSSAQRESSYRQEVAVRERVPSSLLRLHNVVTFKTMSYPGWRHVIKKNKHSEAI